MTSRKRTTITFRTLLFGLGTGTVAGTGMLLGQLLSDNPVVIAERPVRGTAVTDWPVADGYGGAHNSALPDITAANVRRLKVAWTYRTGDVSANEGGVAGTAFEATPIMADTTLYVSTPRNRVIALDAESGAELWMFDPRIDASDAQQKQTTSRGLATWVDRERSENEPCRRRIFMASFDARLFALDGRTGLPCEDFGDNGEIDLGIGVARIAGRRHQYKQTAPPAVIGELVVVGSSIFDSHDADAPSGAVRAFDARTAELRWSWEPVPGVGMTLDDGTEIPAGAANTWATIVADEERDLLFVPTGSPSPDHYGGLRPGDNAYANALVALRGSSGEVVWHFQAVHHDLWDYDLATAPALVTVERDGDAVPAVILASKMGYLFVLHRETGEPLFPIREMPVPASDVPGEVASPTQPVPVLPRPLARQGMTPDDAWGLTPFDRAACESLIDSLRHDGVYAPPSLRGTIVMPGFLGGMEWGGVGYDPDAGLIVTNVNHLAMVATLIPREEVAAATAAASDGKSSVAAQARTPYGVRREALLSPLGLPCTPPPWGTIAAVDSRTGAVRWEVPLGMVSDLAKVPTPEAWGSPNLGGPLITGGLVFIGATMDRRFRAFDLATGRLVWKDKLPASAQATPITYRARPGGRQFIVVAAGGHSLMGTSLGDYLIAYAMPEDAWYPSTSPASAGRGS